MSASTKSPPSNKWPLVLIALAVTVRVIYWLAYLETPLLEWVIADQGFYSRWAERIAGGELLGEGTFEKGPLYAYLLAVGYALGMNNAAVVAVQLLLGTLNCLLVYACGCQLFGRTTGIVAGMIAAVFGPLVFYECMIMKTFLSPLLTITALYAVLRYEEDDARLRWLLAAGAAIGLACLNRENHILLLPPAMMWVWMKGAAFRLSRFERFQHAAAVAVATGAMFLPSIVHNFVAAGEFVAVTTGGGEVFYMAHGPSATGYYQPPDFVAPMPDREHKDFRAEAKRRTGREMTRSESSRYWFGEGLQAIIDSPLRTVQLTLVKGAILLHDFESPDSGNYDVTRPFVKILYILPSFGWISGLGLLGMAVCLREWRRYLLPLGFVAAHATSVLIIYNFGRFRTGMIPVWILFAAYGLTWLVSAWRGGARGQAVTGAVAVGVITYFVLFVPPVGYAETVFESGGAEFRKRILQYQTQSEQRNRFLEMLAENPRDTEAMRGLAEVLEELQLREQAMEYYRRAIEIQPDFVEAYHGLGRMLAKLNDRNQAAGYFEQALEIQPDYAAAHRDLGTLFVRENRFAEAAEHLQKAVALSPQDAESHLWLGIAYMQSGPGKTEEAAAQFHTAIEIDSEFAFARYYLAKLLATRGQTDTAIKQLEKAVDSDTLFTDAYKLLIELRAAREPATDAE